MNTKAKVAAISISAVAALGTGAGLAATAHAGTVPSPGPSADITDPTGNLPDQLPSGLPYAQPSQFQQGGLPSFHRVQPLRNCQLTVTEEVTFIPQLHRFRLQAEPSISCVDQFGAVKVYLLQR